MATKLNYIVNIIPIGDSRPQLEINNTYLTPITINGFAGGNYGLDSLTINYSILNPQANNATIKLLDIYSVLDPDGSSNLNNDIKKGDIVSIYEDYETGQMLVFIGYINDIKFMTGLNSDFIDLSCFNLLQQLSQQNVLKPITSFAQLNTDSNHELTQSLAPNVSSLQNTLSILFDGTLIQFAYQQGYIDQISGVTDKTNPYAFINGSGALQNALSLNNKVIIALSSSMKKTEALTAILQVYQYIYYQDQFGVVRLQPLSTLNTANVLYNFTMNKNLTDYTPTDMIIVNDSIVLNEYIVTAMNVGTIDLELSSLATVQNGLFQRQYDLLKSGYFTNLAIEQQNLPSDILNNQTITNIWYNTQGKGNPYIDVGNSIVTATQTINGNPAVNQVLQLLSTQGLCQSLMSETIITVSTKRDFTIGVELPLAKMVTFNSAGRLANDFTQGLCIGCSLSFGMGQSNLSYQIVKPFTITGIWDEPL